MASVKDDFQELSELLFGAKERYRSARATITHTVDAAVAEEANRRFVDWRFAQDNPGMGIIGKPGPPAREDFFMDYEDTEEVVNFWHEGPDLWREERWSVGGELLRCVVGAGRGAPLWIYHPRKFPSMCVAFLKYASRTLTSPSWLDPSEELFYHSLSDEATVHKTGRMTTVAGRESLEVVVGTISWGYPPIVFRDFYAPQGSTDHLLLVDAEVGTILRVAARLEGREFHVAEVTEVAYDEQFPEDTFWLELPGVEFRNIDR